MLKVLEVGVVADSLQAFAVLDTCRFVVSNILLPLAGFPLHNVDPYL